MKQILILNDGMKIGGTEKLLVGLLNHLAFKCSVTLLLPYPSEANLLLKNIHSAINIKYLLPEGHSRLRRKAEDNMLIFCTRIYEKTKGLKFSDYDCVVCFKDSFYAKLLSIASKPKILWIHNIMVKKQYEIRSFRERMAVWLNKKQLKVTQKSYNKFDIVVCVSDACRNAYINVLHDGRLPKQDIRILYNAIDLQDVIRKSKNRIEPIDQSVTNFVLVTRNSPDKRTDRIINASERLKTDGYNFRVYLIGDEMDSAEMRATLSARELDKYIILMGRTDNPYPYMLQCNWALCVSERESFSLTLLEAMALNTPVITTDCGGPADIIDHGKYGILVTNSTDGVYEGMKQVLEDKALTVKFSSNLREAVSRYDYESWLKSVDDLLNV